MFLYYKFRRDVRPRPRETEQHDNEKVGATRVWTKIPIVYWEQTNKQFVEKEEDTTNGY